MYYVSSMCVTEFAYLKRPLTVDVQLVLSGKWYFRSIFITLQLECYISM